jgi:hypothetical protein
MRRSFSTAARHRLAKCLYELTGHHGQTVRDLGDRELGDLIEHDVAEKILMGKRFKVGDHVTCNSEAGT